MVKSEEELRTMLVDQFGFSYAHAIRILEQENRLFILSCIGAAYSKGKSEIVDSWGNTSYR